MILLILISLRADVSFSIFLLFLNFLVSISCFPLCASFHTSLTFFPFLLHLSQQLCLYHLHRQVVPSLMYTERRVPFKPIVLPYFIRVSTYFYSSKIVSIFYFVHHYHCLHIISCLTFLGKTEECTLHKNVSSFSAVFYSFSVSIFRNTV